MANENNNTPAVEEIKPLKIDDLGAKTLRALALHCEAYKHMNANQVLEVITKKAIRQAANTEFEGKHKAMFKAKQTADRKLGENSTATLNDFLRKIYPEKYEEYSKLLTDLKTYGEFAK